MNIDDSILSKLSDAQKRALRGAATPEDIRNLAKEQGYEMTSEQLDSIAGGDEDRWSNFQGCKGNEWPG